MEIGQVFHLTPLVDDINAACERYEQVFGPHVYYRGFEGEVNNREAALMAIGDFVIEPMQPLPPHDGEPATSHYRYRERFGQAIHSLAVYVDDIAAVRARLEGAGMRAPDGGMPSTVFTHPKDFPGLLEFFQADLSGHPDANPRRHASWDARYWREVQALGMQFVSHVTLMVPDHRDAAAAYVEVLGLDQLPEQPGRAVGCDSSYIAFGPDTVLELAQPGAGSAGAETLAAMGVHWSGASFVVADLDSVEAHLSQSYIGAPFTRSEDTLRLDPGWMFGAAYDFTTRALDGDPRR